VIESATPFARVAADMLGNLVAKMTARHHAEQGDLYAATYPQVGVIMSVRVAFAHDAVVWVMIALPLPLA
jgi:hypothetical protein